jgi:hypothetical protein
LSSNYRRSDRSLSIGYDAKANLDLIKAQVESEVHAAGLQAAVEKVFYYAVESTRAKDSKSLVERWTAEHPLGLVPVSEVERDLTALLATMESLPGRWASVPEASTDRFDAGFAAATKALKQAIA